MSIASKLFVEVEAALREASEAVIMPRYRRLTEAEIFEKTPGELVTVADREAEALIAPRLMAIRPGSRVVGEEAAASNPSLLDRLGEGTVWLLDPLDGTANFAAGRPPFSVMAALVIDGETIGAWLLDVLSGEIAIAARGDGAYLAGERLRAVEGTPGADNLRGAVMTRFMPGDIRASVEARADRIANIVPGKLCAGAEYPEIARGGQDFTLFWRTLPWDHAPGVLFLQEAGGKAARPDGSAYEPASRASGLLLARNPDVWRNAQAALF